MKSLNNYLTEGKKQLVQFELPYKKNELAPVKSEATINYHFGELAAGYVNRFNKREGDPVFNEHGAYLHNVYFAQFQAPVQNNRPFGASKDLIIRKYMTFNNFRDEFEKVAMKIQGSGWVYLNKAGKIISFPNHSEMPTDIALLIDWWEHAWALDYQSDKKQYLKNIWNIINWNVVNAKLV